MNQLFQRKCTNCETVVPVRELRECSKDHDLFCYRLCQEKTCRKYDCGIEGHQTCWQGHLPRQPSLHTLHKQIDLLKGVYVDIVTYSEKNPDEQQSLHDRDHVAQWFVVKYDAAVKEPPRICLTDRFRELCNPGYSDAGYPTRQYPGFISFIGETGMGKSTLLRAMILLGLLEAAEDHQRANGIPHDEDSDNKIEVMRGILSESGAFPVTRAAIIEKMYNPTTYGVHLYKDGGKLMSSNENSPGSLNGVETPILYADCEGFRAGNQTTNAEHADHERRRSPLPSSRELGYEAARHQLNDAPRSASSSTSSLQHLQVGHRGRKEGNPRSHIHIEDPRSYISDHMITAPSYSKQGKAGVDLFYARVLYTISDVIVFVIRSDLTLLTDLQKLVEWCSAAVHRSVNQVAFKTLVIVRNAANLHDEQLYDSAMLYDKMLYGLASLWDGSPELTKLRDEHNNVHKSGRHHIKFNDDLLKLFFKKVRVCYIPDTKRATKVELYGQYRRLRELLIQASRHSQQERSRAWLQYNTPTLSRILTRAFEHFRTTDQPFDFYKAARNDNPSPGSVAEHIENYTRHVINVKSQLPEQMFEQMFSKVISISLVIQAIRDSAAGTDPNEIFRRDLQAKLKLGLQMFQEKHQTCSYIFQPLLQTETRIRCVLKMSPHTNEHADGKGNVSLGQFEDSERPIDVRVEEINHEFNALYEQLCVGNVLPGPSQLRDKRVQVLGEFQSAWALISSNKTCLACLQDSPDHMLPCGHTFCSLCVSEFGAPSEWFECGWVMERCVLCRNTWHDQVALFRLQPRCAGVRVLTLDGGGVRGVVELALLERLSEDLGLQAPMHQYFDLIVGTSTGGIISLALATENQTLTWPKMQNSFMHLAEKTFKSTRGASITMNLDPLNILGGALIIMRLHESVYPTTPLRNSLIDMFTPERKLFSDGTRNVRVAVTAVKERGATPCFITNYNRLQSSNLSNFEREDDGKQDFMVWEAGLATSAAPFWFKPFVKEKTGRDYVDGALFANLPVPAALEEIGRIYADSPKLDILLSIGTGIQDREVQIPKPFRIGGFEHIITNFQASLNTEKTWNNFRHSGSMSHRDLGRLQRLNSPVGGSYIPLDGYKRMQDMHDTVMAQSRSKPLSLRILKSADMLLASLFFFEPDPSPSRMVHRDRITGSIRCRLERGSHQLARLVLKLGGFWYAEIPKEQEISKNTADWNEIQGALQIAQCSRLQDHWLRINCTMQCSDPSNVELVLAVTFKRSVDGSEQRSTPIPISGFPITLQELRSKARYI